MFLDTKSMKLKASPTNCIAFVKSPDEFSKVFIISGSSTKATTQFILHFNIEKIFN